MTRHGFVRLRLVAASAVLAAGLSPLLPSAPAVADAAQETVVPATMRSTYTSGALWSASTYSGHDAAGTQGVFHTLEGAGLVWTRYADGTSVPVTRPTGSVVSGGSGGDVMVSRYSDGRVDLWNAVDGSTRTLQAPEGLSVLTGYQDLAVAYRNVPDENGTAWREMHLLLPAADGGTRDVPVTGVPAGVNLGQPVGADADGLLFQGAKDGQYLSVMVDRHTGQVRDMTPLRTKVYLKAQVTSDHVVLFNLNETTVLVYDRADLSAAPVEVPLAGSGVNPAQDLAVVGDWLVHRPSGGTTVYAKAIAGGPEVTLLAGSNVGVSAVSDGTAVAVGRTSAATDDWGVQRIAAGADGRPTVTMVKPLPKPPYPIQGLSLDQGRLVEADASWGNTRDTYGRTVAVTGTPTYGPRSNYDGTDIKLYSCPAGDVGCSQVFGTAAGPTVWLERESGEYDRLRVNGPGQYAFWDRDVPAGGRITDVSGTYVLYTTATQQYVYKIRDDAPAKVTRAPGAAALSGDLLWTADVTPGRVSAYDLSAKRTVETLTLDGVGCAPTELQALGRYLYWNCGDTAGVFDRTTKKSVSVPADEAKLGDGYVVTHDKAAEKLVLTTVAEGNPVSRVIGELPDTGVSQRDVRWTVDESGANAAYVDAQERVHIVPSGVPQQPLRLLDPPDSLDMVTTDIERPEFSPLTRVLLSKPAAGWQLTVRSKATGKVVDTRSGGETRGELKVEWYGRTSAGRPLPNGGYDWALSVDPADGVGAPLQVNGSVQVRRGAAVHRDYVGDVWGPDGIGDLLTLSSSGKLAFQQGTGKGTFSGTVTGIGWPTTIRPVPFGDLNGDRCNDVLVRLSSGALRAYRPDCGGELAPSTPYTSLGTSGWNQYDVLTSPGDVTKDGRPDLIARNASTGTVYLYKGTSTGKLSARVTLYGDWRGYKKVVGAGDLNGDGIGDLLAQDRANTLYRYYGKGDGTFGARAKLFSNWGGSYNALVGVGDITGDGKADLVERDTAGNVYRNSGDGKGSFGGRVKIASGWQGYKGIF
ncbi:VCBS repeat-containing protein [Streptomyces sp. TLI_185]|uniref:FG-GAP repeat domain-containing protein n=1 Tax=Streptomyces sp. TLI_185 TaxID=2485151 RepID=UPI000F4E00C4|nr:VCBS repeat-containing protein [Streptomyces sp. TLI_185]RPF34641.1 VCBS repeat protein [Streptomyces sp. TLI_185]